MSEYQVIITLGGNGKRFSDAGYDLPKYLLPVSIFDTTYTVIDLVASMYNNKNTDIIFLCNKDHVSKYRLDELLGIYGKVISVVPGKGPGDAILQASDSINLNKKTFVQYCDTYQNWDFDEIKNSLSDADSAVVVTDERCPSVFDGTLYGRVKLCGNKVEDIKEKAEESFSNFLGCGTFYFKDGATLLKYVKIQDLNKDKYYLNGESYINCTIKAMLDDDKVVHAINTKGYLNLGVPRDYEDFIYWQKLILRYSNKSYYKQNSIKESVMIVPAAGLGSRFKEYCDTPKPLIDVVNSHSPMFIESINNSFNPEKAVVVTRKDIEFFDQFKEEANKNNVLLVGLDKITDGQAITVKNGLSHINTTGPIIINSCDQGIIYNEDKLKELYKDSDVIICGIKNYLPAINKVNSFSWIKHDGNRVTKITSKKCEENPKESLTFVSCLLYKNKEILENSISSLINRDARVNGELYIDESINDSISLGYRVNVLEIDSYINWGTPEELRLFKWWYNFFNESKFI